jgi:hypothetical protein
VSGVKIDVTTASANTSHTNRCRADSQTALTIARTAVSGAKTTMKCTNNACAGRPLMVDMPTPAQP